MAKRSNTFLRNFRLDMDEYANHMMIADAEITSGNALMNDLLRKNNEKRLKELGLKRTTWKEWSTKEEKAKEKAKMPAKKKVVKKATKAK